MFPTKVALFALFSLFLAEEKKEDDVGVLHSQYTGWKRGEGRGGGFCNPVARIAKRLLP